MALTRSSQVPLAAAVHVLADAARLAVAALAEAARGAAWLSGGRRSDAAALPWAAAVMVISCLSQNWTYAPLPPVAMTVPAPTIGSAVALRTSR